LVYPTRSDHTSILKFIESVYGLPALTSRDSSANNLLDAFSFSHAPSPPLILPGPFIENHYPLVPMRNGSTVPVKAASPSNPLPNLTVEKVILKPARPSVGELVSVNCTITNIGTGSASGVAVSLYLNDSSHNYALIQSSYRFDLQPGESKQISFPSALLATTGVHSIIAVVDPADTIKQVQKDNDGLIRTLRISAPAPALPPAEVKTITVSSAVSTTLTVPSTVIVTSSITSTYLQTVTSTITQVVTTGEPQSSAPVYGSTLILVAAVVLVILATIRRAPSRVG